MFEIKSGVKDPPNSEREDQYVHVVKHFHIWWTFFCLDCACTKGERGLGSGFLLFIYGIFYGISGGYIGLRATQAGVGQLPIIPSLCFHQILTVGPHI